jgi:hypothetical protein
MRDLALFASDRRALADAIACGRRSSVGLQFDFDAVGKGFEIVLDDAAFEAAGIDSQR